MSGLTPYSSDPDGVCDYRACPAQSRFFVRFPVGYLVLCTHHLTEAAPHVEHLRPMVTSRITGKGFRLVTQDEIDARQAAVVPA